MKLTHHYCLFDRILLRHVRGWTQRDCSSV